MRFIPTRVHGILDYLMGIVLLGAPWFLGFNSPGADTYLPVLLGILAISYSLFTDYEFGAVKVLSMQTHLWFDLASGVLLAASPWLFDFADHVYLPHLVLGLVEIAASLLTERKPKYHPAHATDKHEPAS